MLSLKLKTKTIDFSLKPILDKNNNIIEIMAIGKDVTKIIKLYEEIEDTQKDIIFSLGTIGEKRSEETGNHVKRVGEFSYIY